MVKKLLSLSLTALVMTSASAVTLHSQRNASDFPKKNLMHKDAERQSQKLSDFTSMKEGNVMKFRNKRAFRPTRADETLNLQWGYCGDPYTALTLDDYTVNQAVYVAEEFTEELAGAEVRNILMANPVNAKNVDEEAGTYGNPCKTATVWICYELGGEHVAEATGDLGEFGFEWSSIALENPYVIEAGKPFYVGVTYSLPKNNPYCYGYLTDYEWPEYENTNIAYTRFIGWDENDEMVYGDEKDWIDISYDFGNACIRLDVYGDNLPTNVCGITEYYAPNYVAPGEKVPVSLGVKNGGANVITSVDITLDYADGSSQTLTSEILVPDYDIMEYVQGEIAYNQVGVVYAEFNAPTVEANMQYTLRVSKVNGTDDNNSDSKVEGVLLCMADGYHKNVVVEEATGTWCGYCVLGYAGMKYLAKNYAKDGVIGVALHGSDEMDVLTNGTFSELNQYIDGFPSSFYNRDFLNSIYPDQEYFNESLPDEIAIPAMASIKATLEPGSSDKNLILSTESTFLLSGEEGEYAVAYTVLEDGVGPYPQTNYMSGSPYDAYGFEDLPDPCPLVFDDVARNCSKPYGIEGSLPAVAKGETYSYTCDIELTDVTKPNHCRVVAMVINQVSGRIENACVVESPTYNYVSAVEKVSTDTTQDFARGVKGAILINGNSRNVNVYTLSGARVAAKAGYRVEVPAGIYIVTRDGKAAKVVVK